MKYLAHTFFSILLAAAWFGSGAFAQAVAPEDQQLARAVVEFSSNACYGLATGATVLPGDQSPDALNQTIHTVEKMGLSFGVDDKMLKQLGTPGLAIVSRSTMGSKTLDHGNVVVTFGGPLPGCRVILLTETPVNVADAVSASLASAGWKSVPAIQTQRAKVERRSFVKRDIRGDPYLMNLMAIGEPNSKIRLITTTIRIPASVTLPSGL